MSKEPLSSTEFLTKILDKHNLKPKIAIILGSGLGHVVDAIQNCLSVDYSKIPNFPQTKVKGHRGRLHLGTIGSVTVACLEGRSHFYEGTSSNIIINFIETLKNIGCQSLIITNSAGSLNDKISVGHLMMIRDHINFQFTNVLSGHFQKNDNSPFINMQNAYCPVLRKKFQILAQEEEIILHEGVYMGVLGPSFETPAEILAFKKLGADAIGMSTIPEVIAARYFNLSVLAISVMTNMAAGLSDEILSHEKTLEMASLSCSHLSRLIIKFLRSSF